MTYIYDILYEIFKMFIEMSPYLLLGLAFVALLNIFVNKDLISKQIGDKSILSILKAALFGIPLPLCSCGVVPTTVYLHRNGASKASTLSFLISTPQTGIDSIIATYGLMGPIFAIFRPIAALIMGIIGGLVANIFEKNENEEIKPKAKVNPKQINFNIIEQTSIKKDTVCDDNCGEKNDEIANLPLKNRIIPSLKYAFIDFVDDISNQFIVGVIISGLIAFFIPESFFSDLGIGSGILGMLIMVAIGIPMYVCATASIPIALILIAKGFSPGVAFVFLATGPATNAASIAIIGKTLGKKITLIYLLTIIVSSIIMGTLLDLIFNYTGTIETYRESLACHTDIIEGFDLKLVFGIIFASLLIYNYIRKFHQKYSNKKSNNKNIHSIKIEGMTCNHCVNNVQKALTEIEGITNVNVSLVDNCVYYEGNIDKKLIIDKINSIGYKAFE